MNLFALTNIPAARIVRFPLSAGLQSEAEAVFGQQLQAFEAGVVETIPFDGRYTPEQGELLVINDFADVEGLQEAVANPLNVEVFDPNQHPLGSVKALFTSKAENGIVRILVQSFERRRMIANKGLAMFFSGDTFQKMNDAGLTLDTKLLAVLEGASLKFQSFHFLGRVFDVGDYFNEATSEEVGAFATHPKLSVDDVPGFLASANQLVRKKIALITQSGVLEKYTVGQIVVAAQTFNLAIATSPDGRIVLPTNKTELRRVLRFLDEDYYESALSQTLMLTNSKRAAH